MITQITGVVWGRVSVIAQITGVVWGRVSVIAQITGVVWGRVSVIAHITGVVWGRVSANIDFKKCGIGNIFQKKSLNVNFKAHMEVAVVILALIRMRVGIVSNNYGMGLFRQKIVDMGMCYPFPLIHTPSYTLMTVILGSQSYY